MMSTLNGIGTKNNGALADMPHDVAVEISSYIYLSGTQPITMGNLPILQKGLLQIIKLLEELAIKAAVTGCYDTALQPFL